MAYRNFKSIDGPTDYAVGDPNRGLDPYAGNTYRGKTIADQAAVIQHIDAGYSITPVNGIITYGFYTGNHAVGLNNNPQFGEGKGYTPFTAAQEAAAVKAIGLWDDLMPATFVNVGDVGVKGWAHTPASAATCGSPIRPTTVATPGLNMAATE